MKCPLMSMGAYTGGKIDFRKIWNCLKEECAWWDNGAPGCAILTIAQELAIKRQKEEVER